MMMVEEYKKGINKEIQKYRNTGEHIQTGERFEHNHPGSKNGSRNNKEITKGDNSGKRKPKKEVRSHIGKHNRIQEIEERISGVEDTIENIDKTVKENSKSKKLLTQNIQEIQDTMRRPNLRIIV